MPQGEAGPGLCRLPCQRRGTPPYSEHPVRTRCPGDEQRTAITARNHSKCTGNVSSFSFKVGQALAMKEVLRGHQACPPTLSDVSRVPLLTGAS